MNFTQTRFLQFEIESTFISTGYVESIAVWHHAPHVFKSSRVLLGLTDSLNRRGNCNAGGSEHGAAGSLGFASELKTLSFVLDIHVL